MADKKKYTNGLVIGKFCPLHKGHQYLIETALKSCEKLTIIVCHTAAYTIPVEIRSEWIKELYPQAEVKILCHDASLDDDTPNASERWAKKTVDFLGYVPDAVFTSEEYGDYYAKYMGCEHVLVDLERKKFNISGRVIRKDPLKSWDFLPDNVKSYFAKRVVVVGAESTGTTTLSQDLAKYYHTAWVPEYGRYYYEGKMHAVDSDIWDTKEFEHIASQQNSMEDALARKCNKVLVCDTDSFATAVWHLRYMGYKADDLHKFIKERKGSLYIVTDVDIPFVQDGTRDGEHLRKWMHQVFLEELEKAGQKYIVVHGNKEDRVKQAVKEIDSLVYSTAYSD